MAGEILDQIRLSNGTTIRLVKGDITQRNVDVIVNAANSYLKHGGGVAAAIVRKGGRIIQQESDKIGFVPVGFAALTNAGKLSCKAVIHAVGPTIGDGDEDNKLRRTLRSSLTLASEKGFKSMSIPAISAGIFGFPKDKCAKILVGETIHFLNAKDNNSSIETVEFCLIDNETLRFFKLEFDINKSIFNYKL